MDFNIERYITEKKKVITKIKETHDWEISEGFIADGLINPKKYEREKIKIVCVLSESYGYNDCKVVDIETQQNNDVLGVSDANIKATTKLPALLWLFFESIEKNKKILFEDMPKLYTGSPKNVIKLHNAIEKIGWVNVKKASRPVNFHGKGSKSQIDREVYEHALRNEEALKIQINSMNPDLLIACGNPVIMGLANLKLYGKGINIKEKNIVQVNNLGKKIILLNHPSSRDWSYEKMYSKFQVLFDHFSEK